MKTMQPDFSRRDALSGVDDLFVQRWSPRSYARQPVPADDLAIMFDAARWAPSCYNEQPWCFYTSTDTSYDTFLSLLVDANQRWAVSAPVIGFVVASRHFARNGKPNAHAKFDAGSAWMAFNLQASKLGYHVHGMAGVHYEKVYEVLELDPGDFEVVCGFTVGKVDDQSTEELTERKPLAHIWKSL